MNAQTKQLKTVSAIISPTWLVTALASKPLLASHSVVIDAGVIIDILPTDQIKQQYHTDSHYQLPGQVLMPGLVNLHSHVPMSLLRGFADDLPLMTWLNDYIWPAESTSTPKPTNYSYQKDYTH